MSIALAFTIVVTWAPICAASGETGSSRGAARELGYQGVAAYQAGDYRTAVDKLEKAYQALQAPSLALWSARALRESGRWVEASERFREAGRLPVSSGDPALQEKSKHEAESELAELSPKIPALSIRLDGASVDEIALSLDGASIASALVGEWVPVNPGSHHVRALRGSDTSEADVDVAPGEHARVALHFAPPIPAQRTAPPAKTVATPPAQAAKPSSASPWKTLGIVATSVGGAAVITGVVTGILALGKKSGLEKSPDCRGTHCLPSEADRVDAYETLRTTATVSLVAGGILAAGGVGVLVLAPSSRSHEVTLGVVPFGIRAGGVF